MKQYIWYMSNWNYESFQFSNYIIFFTNASTIISLFQFRHLPWVHVYMPRCTPPNVLDRKSEILHIFLQIYMKTIFVAPKIVSASWLHAWWPMRYFDSYKALFPSELLCYYFPLQSPIGFVSINIKMKYLAILFIALGFPPNSVSSQYQLMSTSKSSRRRAICSYSLTCPDLFEIQNCFIYQLASSHVQNVPQSLLIFV